MASGRRIRGSSSASASTPIGRRPNFPPELAGSMTSLREASHGRPIDLALLLDAFLGRIEARVEALRGGRFDVADWQDRQLTTGRIVRLETRRRQRNGPRHRRRRHDGRPRGRGRGGAAWRAPGHRRRDQPRPPGRAGRSGGVTRWPVRHSGRWTVRRRADLASPRSIATARSSRRRRRTRPDSTPSIGSTSPRCTATRTTSSTTTTRRKTPPSGPSWPP